MDVMKRVAEHYAVAQMLGHEVVGVFLHGSQNYGLEYEGSDIDTKAITVPSFESFVHSHKPVSATHVMENGEHLDLKDIRLMFDCFRKQNVNFVEILFTEYAVFNPKYKAIYQPVIDAREKIARYNTFAAINCLSGMAMDKWSNLGHATETTAEAVKKFGYDPKQIHHIARLHEFMQRYIAGVPYVECLKSEVASELIDLKRGTMPYREAREYGCGLVNSCNGMKEEYMKSHTAVVDRSVEEVLDRALGEILKKRFLEELLGEE